ncbi:hypothetical protein FA15DRAFT_759278 [Coprinopsis marcescibilis]|uniref:Uncharacterized protein n=1 Tax=Coprinopsis marcescibilis TaxID=230819 RepID=A0A5C3KXE5_COPMA|nr:hypothetical protein FA15DRAFT_759278 [Coprinopsis marcescibilis]
MQVTKARLRAVSEHCSLALDARYSMARNDGHLQLSCTKELTKLPEVQVYAAQAITLTFSGTVNNEQIPVAQLSTSQLVTHLRDYLEMAKICAKNAKDLVLESLDHLASDDCCNAVTLNLTPQYAARNPRSTISSLRLHAVDLKCSWKLNTPEQKRNTVEDPDYHPFAQNTSLAFVTMFNDVIGRFLTQLVRRYPLIFGYKCEQSGIEEPFTRSILKTISSIKARSRDKNFLRHCNKLSKKLHRQLSVAHRSASMALDICCGPTADVVPPHDWSAVDFPEAFLHSMETLYQSGIPERQFKGTSRFSSVVSDDKDLLENNEDLSADPIEDMHQLMPEDRATLGTTWNSDRTYIGEVSESDLEFSQSIGKPGDWDDGDHFTLASDLDIEREDPEADILLECRRHPGAYLAQNPCTPDRDGGPLDFDDLEDMTDLVHSASWDSNCSHDLGSYLHSSTNSGCSPGSHNPSETSLCEPFIQDDGVLVELSREADNETGFASPRSTVRAMDRYNSESPVQLGFEFQAISCSGKWKGSLMDEEHCWEEVEGTSDFSYL